MQEMAEADKSLSQQTIATKATAEFSTKLRNCYQWKYKWTNTEREEVHKQAEQHMTRYLAQITRK